jgi:exodeoxyribonuclease V
MIKDFAATVIKKHLKHNPTSSQEHAIELLSEYITNADREEVFILKGYAGTGKTTLLSAVINTLNEFKLQSVLLAPTGRAAKVLSKYSGKEAYTIHKKIYRQKSSVSEQFVLDVNLHSNTIFIVDEASMISDSQAEYSIFGTGCLLVDLITYVFNNKGCGLILTGDTAQLPPIGLNTSPALEPSYIERSFLRNTISTSLTDVVRQTQMSGILHNATEIRKLISTEKPNTPKFRTSKFPDISKIANSELLETISSCYDRQGIDETIIITRSNKRANKYNEGIRRTILYKEEEISSGDYVMVVKNNYYDLEKVEELAFIANGDIAQIMRIKRYDNLYGLRFADVTLRFPDYNDLELDRKIILNTLTSETASMSGEEYKQLVNKVLEDYQNVRTKKERVKIFREDPFLNALQVKFAYCITCHKAQGGQWENVFIDHDYLPNSVLEIDNLRWFYTAVTRASKHLYLSNFKEDFFE